jgi:hypothetical protein
LNQIGFAAVFGSPLAGCWLMARNLRAVGRSRGRAFAVGLLAMAALVALNAVLPTRSSFGLAVLAGLAVRGIAEAQQGDLIDERIAAGLPLQSWWKTIGITIAIAVAVFAGVTGAIVLLQTIGT